MADDVDDPYVGFVDTTTYSSLNDMVNEIYANMTKNDSSIEIISNNTRTIDGTTAYDIIHTYR